MEGWIKGVCTLHVRPLLANIDANPMAQSAVIVLARNLKLSSLTHLTSVRVHNWIGLQALRLQPGPVVYGASEFVSTTTQRFLGRCHLMPPDLTSEELITA